MRHVSKHFVNSILVSNNFFAKGMRPRRRYTDYG